MIYLNYNNLDAETQQRLLENSKKEVEQTYGKELKSYAQEFHLNYETLLDEEAVKHLYSYQFIFNI